MGYVTETVASKRLKRFQALIAKAEAGTISDTEQIELDRMDREHMAYARSQRPVTERQMRPVWLFIGAIYAMLILLVVVAQFF